MRRTRSTKGNKGRKSDGKLGNIIIFFVIAPILAIAITIGLFRYLILPQISPSDDTVTINENVDSDSTDDSTDDETQQETETTNNTENSQILTFSLEGMNLYNIQIGSFSEKNNAQNLVDRLRNKGIDGYVVERDSFKVFAGTFFSRGDAEVYLNKVREVYPDSFIKKFDINGAAVNYMAKEEEQKNAIKNLVSNLNSIFSEESTMWSNAVKTNSAILIKETMKENNSQLENEFNEIKGQVQSEELVKLIDSIEAQLGERKTIVNDLKVDDIESISIAYKKFNTTLFKYMKVITQQG